METRLVSFCETTRISRCATRSDRLKDIAPEDDAHPGAAEMDQEDVAHMFRREDILSAPVIDKSGRLIGAITIDDVIDVIDQEAQEDIKKLNLELVKLQNTIDKTRLNDIKLDSKKTKTSFKADKPTPIYTDKDLASIFALDEESISGISKVANKLSETVNKELQDAADPVKAYTSRIEGAIT